MDSQALTWQPAPQWALNVGALGRGLIDLGLVGFVFAALILLLATGKPKMERAGNILFVIANLSVFGAFAALGVLFVQSQFEFDYVQRCIQAGLELKYRIAAIWSHQEGSFLLWAVTSALFGLLAAPKMGSYRRWFTITYAFFVAALCAILAFETPFGIDPSLVVHGQTLMPPDGGGLTPSLQNYWVVIHPPTIFLGFGSLTVMFCAAVAALMTGNPNDWVKPVRPWALLSLAILGLGLCMGGFWAYETLNWGGFWAWDPVENASFVPWMLTATLIHGLIVQATKKNWVRINLVFAALPFLAFVYGTYLTRSGVYADVSVHSFAEMNRTALKILLGLMGVVSIGFAGLMAWRWKAFAPAPGNPEPAGLTRTAGYNAGVLVLCGIGLATALGMSVPLFQFIAGRKPQIVEEPLYHQVLGWFFPFMMLLMAVVPFMSWRPMGLRALWYKVMTAVSFSFMFTGIAIFIIRHPAWGVGLTGAERVAFPGGATIPALPWLGFLVFLCIFAILTNLLRMFELRRQMKLGLGGFLAHVGVATLLTGMILSRGFERSEVQVIQRGESASVLGYVAELEKFTGTSLTDRDNKVEFAMQGPNERFTARPGLYAYDVQNDEPKWMTWPHIQRYFSHDIYFALSPPIIHVWKDAVPLTPNQSHAEDNVKVTYDKFTMHGQPGQPGTQFGAAVTVETPDGVYHVEPTVELAQGDMVQHPVKVNKDIFVAIKRFNASDRSAAIEVNFVNPPFQIELYYKPMTSFVWFGAGIMFLGSLMSAAYRRKAVAPAPESPIVPIATPLPDEVAQPVPQN